MEATASSVVRQLAQRYAVVTLGGLAVIGHGFSRPTLDADIWLDPRLSATEWASALLSCIADLSAVTIHRLPGWVEVLKEDLAGEIDEVRMVRIFGLDRPLDVFRHANEFETHEFSGVLERATQGDDRCFLPSALDLMQSKIDTGRDKDFQDLLFLENLVRQEYREKLPTATLPEATALLDRFCEHEVLAAALENPDQEVKDLALGYLREFAAEGDPFSRDILAGKPTLPTH